MSEDDRTLPPAEPAPGRPEGGWHGARVASRLRPLLPAIFAFLPLVSCRPPIACMPGQEAREETMCPSCPTIDDPPPGYCPCTKGWVCRETEEHAAARREAQRSRARPQPDRVDPAAAREAEMRLLARENTLRLARAVGRFCDGDAGCASGQWSRKEETGERGPDGRPLYREVCVPIEGQVMHPPCPDPERDRRRKEMEERSVAAFAEARAACPQMKRCGPRETAVVQFVCIQAATDPEPGEHVIAEPSCALLAGPTSDEGRMGCPGKLVTRPACKPPDPPGKPGMRRPN